MVYASLALLAWQRISCYENRTDVYGGEAVQRSRLTTAGLTQSFKNVLHLKLRRLEREPARSRCRKVATLSNRKPLSALERVQKDPSSPLACRGEQQASNLDD